MIKPPSKRQLLAEELAQYIVDSGLTNPFGGEVYSDKQHYTVLFSRPATLDGAVKVYSDKFIQVLWAAGSHREGRVFETPENAKDFIKYAFVEYNSELRDAIPTKPETVKAKPKMK